MAKGTVLIIGNSGVGKSTLVNAVLGEEVAEARWGNEGTTKELRIYENEELPFRVIDTVGFEPTFLKEQQAIKAVRDWSKDAVKQGMEDRKVSVIWFCVDGTSRKLFDKTIKDLSSATRMWPSVPIIVVITKSYSIPEREENVAMVQAAFERQRTAKNLKRILPVVASTYVLNDTAYAPPEGITELIETTNELLPEGEQAATKDLASYNLNRKNVMAHSMVGVAVAGAVTVGAVPIPIPDGTVLTPIEIGLVNGIAKIYGIEKSEQSSRFVQSIIEVGTVGVVAKQVLVGLKAIPGINIAASVLNAIVAGAFVAAIGEGSKYLFEQIYLGNKTVDDINWAKKIIESKLASEVLENVTGILKETGGKFDKKTLVKLILSFAQGKNGKKNEKSEKCEQ